MANWTFLTSQQKQQFDRDGFLVIPDFFTKQQAQQLLNRSKELLDAFDMADHPMTKFTSNENNHVGDDYFLNSGDQIRFFFEEDAFNDQGQLIVPKAQAINKMGHGLHILDTEFRAFSTRDALKGIALDVGFQDPLVLQSMVICKQPRIGGEVKPHQDSTFLYTQPPSAVGFWFALEDCTKENGCMWFAPGSHRNYSITKRFVRRPDQHGTTFIPIGQQTTKEPLESDYVCAETPAGSLVLIHGSVYHKSSHNYSDKSRFIYTFHMIDGKYEYPDNNWLQPTVETPFMRLLEQS